MNIKKYFINYNNSWLKGRKHGKDYKTNDSMCIKTCEK